MPVLVKIDHASASDACRVHPLHMKFALPPPSRYWLLLLSFLGALAITYGASFATKEQFVSMRVQSEQSTMLTLFADLGQGVVARKDQSTQLTGGEVSHILRFALPSGCFRSLRLDFAMPADRIRIYDLSITDAKNLPIFHLALDALHPLHKVRIAKNEENMVEFVADGDDPQIRIDFPWWRLRLGSMRPGPVLALTLLAYPVLVASAAVCRRRWPWRKPADIRRTVADPLMLAGLFCWLLATLYAAHPRSVRQEYTIANRPAGRYLGQSAGQEVWLARPDGLGIAGRLYGKERSDRHRGAIVLLHGNYPEGQMFPLYPVLAQELSARGYLVLTIDFAGFGDSVDPFASEQPRKVDLESETEAAISYLAGIAPEQGGRIGVIGHSMGADPALRVGLRNRQVGVISLLGPPRRVWDRFHTAADIGFFWNWAIQVGRKRYNRDGFPTWYGKERWRQDILQRDMALMLPWLTGWRHKPVLFVDGGREPFQDRAFLDDYVRRISFPKRYVTLNGADHNSNVRLQGGEIFYEKAVMDQSVAVLDDWHQTNASGRPIPLDYGRNLLRWLFFGLPVIGGR